mgnify:CR=1 FL=1
MEEKIWKILVALEDKRMGKVKASTELLNLFGVVLPNDSEGTVVCGKCEGGTCYPHKWICKKHYLERENAAY